MDIPKQCARLINKISLDLSQALHIAQSINEGVIELRNSSDEDLSILIESINLARLEANQCVTQAKENLARLHSLLNETNNPIFDAFFQRTISFENTIKKLEYDLCITDRECYTELVLNNSNWN